MRFLTILLILATLLTVFVSPAEAMAVQEPDGGGSMGALQATGLNEPTAAQDNWMKKNFPVIQKVKLNSIALERINAERVAKGLNKLSDKDMEIAPVGDEAVFATSDGTYQGTTTQISGALPGSVDNSASPAFPPIRSQGGIGSCAAWATTYYQFTYETNLARSRTASNGDNSNIFSPKWTYNLINGGTDAGAYFSDAYNLEIKNGAASWAEFPYNSNYLEWNLNSSTWRNAINYRPESYGQIYNSNPDLMMDSLKTQLANGHVLVIGTYVLSWKSGTLKDDPGTALDDPFVNQVIATYCQNNNAGGHAMTVVGYNDNLWCDLNGNGVVNSGEKGAFKIANSWGTGDWNGGYRWVTYDALRTSSAVTPAGAWPTNDRASGGILWGGCVYTLTVNPDYQPSAVAEVTLNSTNRGQLALLLGTGSTAGSQPGSTWSPEALVYSGGNYAFNGTSTACDGTFVFDFSDLGNSTSGDTRWFMGLYNNAASSATSIKSYKLYRVTAIGDAEMASAVNMPVNAASGQNYAWVDGALNAGNEIPVAVLSASSTSANINDAVNFDGSASHDPDGSIVAYAWDFGDGVTGTGPAASHVYKAAGSYTARLTVKDDKGASSASSTAIKISDPNIINSPSGLTARVSLKNVTLTWTDNSGNEDGFYIERGIKNKNGYTYTVVGKVGTGVTTFTDPNVKAGTYYYRVRSYNTTGLYSGYSNGVSVRVR